jgi:hypothetical protein
MIIINCPSGLDMGTIRGTLLEIQSGDVSSSYYEGE